MHQKFSTYLSNMNNNISMYVWNICEIIV
jgi:hypothetical protein